MTGSGAKVALASLLWLGVLAFWIWSTFFILSYGTGRGILLDTAMVMGVVCCPSAMVVASLLLTQSWPKEEE